MAGYFSLGENKIRPGAYFNVQKRGDETNFGAIDGIVAVLFKSSIGPLGKATVLPASEGYENTFGTGGTTDALREAFYGGAVKLIAVRVGNGGTVGSASLACATGKAKLSTKYPSGAKFTATIREKLGDSSKKECIVYLDDSEFEKVTFAAGAEEATALKEAFASSKNFVVDITDASGAVTAVSQSAFADGADPTVTNADYSAGLKEVEKYFFNTICVDTEDAAVHALVAAFLDRIYLAGSFGMAIVTPKPSSSLEDRMTSISSFDTENVIAPLNANANAGNEELKGYQVAAYIAGIVAATPANQSVTHATLSRYSVLNEILTNTEMEVAEEKGCLVLSTPFNRGAWHVGVNYGGGLFGICNNHNSIGIEMCVQAGYNYDKAFRNTVEICKMLMQKFGIDADHVVSHYDVCAKNCPSAIRAKGDWNRFKQLIGAKAATTTVDKYYRIRKTWGDSKGQLGAYKNLENAKKDWKEGYTIYDWNGKAVYPEQKKDTSSRKEKADLTVKLDIQLPVLQSGTEGVAVRCLQSILGVSVDGDFGKNTKSALKTFQRNVGIDDDGCCGQNTWKKIADHMNANTFK